LHLKLVITNKDNQLLTNYIRTKIFLILLGGFLFNSITFAQNILNSNSSQLKPIDGSPPKLDLGAKPPSHVFFSSYLNGQITVLWSPPNLSGKTGPSPHVVGNPSVRNANFCIDCVCPTTGCGKNPVVINLEYLIEESVDGGPFQQIHTLYIGAADTSKYKTERLIIQRPTGNYRFKVKAKYNNYNYNQWPQIHSVSHAVLSTPSIQASGESLVWNAPPANIETELEYAQCSSPCGNIAGSQWHDIEPTSSTSLSLIPFNITHNAFRLRHCKVTGVVSCTNWSPIYKHNIPKANLKQTWVPIAVGDITTFIPVGDASAISEDYNIQLSERDGNRYLTWSTAISATRFQIQGLNKQGQWVTITYTENYGVLIDSSFDNYTKIKVLACNGNVCGQIGNSPEIGISKRSVVFIHTDLLGSPVAETDKNGDLQ
jgi:hypothetical protein